MERLAGEISDAYDDGVVLIAVLKGAVPFLADLVRHVRVVPLVDFSPSPPTRRTLAGCGS